VFLAKKMPMFGTLLKVFSNQLIFTMTAFHPFFILHKNAFTEINLKLFNQV